MPRCGVPWPPTSHRGIAPIRLTADHVLRECRHGKRIDRRGLARHWVRYVFQILDTRVERVDGRAVLIADGKNIAKQGRRMPAVERLHQASGNSARPEFIRAHPCQAVSLLVNATAGALVVPPGVRIHEGLALFDRRKRTLLGRLLGLVEVLSLPDSRYPAANASDAAYANGKMSKDSLVQWHHRVTRVRTDVVAYESAPVVPPEARRRGRPRKTGDKTGLPSSSTSRASRRSGSQVRSSPSAA